MLRTEPESVRANADDISQLPEIRGLGFIVKVSERCNIACTYCYFFFHQDQSYLDHPANASIETLSELLAFIEVTVIEHDLTEVAVGLHGGEPLMAPKSRVREFCDRLYGLKQTTPLKHIQITVQTNGMLVDEDWLDLFEEYEIGCGVSLDGPKATNDLQRIDKRARGTYDRSIAGYEKLKAASQTGRIPAPGILCVVDPAQSGEEIFRHFVEDLDCQNVNFLTPDLHFDDEVVDEAFVAGIQRYLVDVFRTWLKLDDRRVRVRFIEEFIRPLLSDEEALSAHEILRNYNGLLTVSSNGQIAPEDTIKTVAARFHDNQFACSTSSLSEILASDTWREIDAARLQTPTGCKSCDWWGVCRGGNIVNRFSRHRGFDNPSVFCGALKAFYGDAAAWLIERGVCYEDLNRRLNLASNGPR